MKPRKNSLKRRRNSSNRRTTKVRYVPAKLKGQPSPLEVALHRQSTVLLHWTTVLLLLLTALFASFTLLPFLLLADIVAAILFLVLFGLCYGYVFYLLIEHIEPVWYHHKLFAAVFIPLVSVMAVVAVGTVAQSLAALLFFTPPLSPIEASLIYLSAFIAPYLFFLFLRPFLEQPKRQKVALFLLVLLVFCYFFCKESIAAARSLPCSFSACSACSGLAFVC